MVTKANLMGTGTSALAAVAAVGIPATGQTATGNSQGTALVCPSDFVVFTTVGASTGVILPSNLSIGDCITIVNHGANSLSVYPPTGGKIANGSANAALALAATKTGFYTAIDSSGNFAAAISA